MKAEDLTFEELVGYENGRLQQHGRRLLVHDMCAQAQFRHDLIQMVGEAQARRIITRFGYFWGQADASAMKRLYHWDSLRDLIEAFPRLLMLQGVCGGGLVSLELDEAGGSLEAEFIWRNLGELEFPVVPFDRKDTSSCWKIIGYASGYCTYCLGRQVYFIARREHGPEGDFCRIECRDSRSWGPEAREELQYFKAADINAKIDKLAKQVKKAESELEKSRRQLEKAISGPRIFPVEVRNQRFIEILKLAGKVAGFDTSVLITGETGVGKEVLARLIHRLSSRSDGPFVTVDCLAMPESLCESELFGHAAGSFTGAVGEKKGLFEEAGGGTVFLDEVGDISPGMQMKLLRVLQDHEILRLGETRSRKVDVRVIAATNRDLESKVAEGAFRQDLYYRLCVVKISLPALRQRTEDILPLARHFVKKLQKKLDLPHLRLDPSCIDYLEHYSWPGNIRELENAIERAAVICTGNLILPEHLPMAIRTHLPGMRENKRKVKPLREVETEQIACALQETGGHRRNAARLLGIGESTLYRKIRQYGLH